MDIWRTNQWKKVLPDNCRQGLRTRFDKGVSLEIKEYSQNMCNWLRYYWDFPVRVPVYFKNTPFITASDGGKCYALFFAPDCYSDEPYIKISVGDYDNKVEKWGKEKAIASILLDIPHELTHYFQWINNANLTEIGKERQALRYARTILEYFFEECYPDLHRILYDR